VDKRLKGFLFSFFSLFGWDWTPWNSGLSFSKHLLSASYKVQNVILLICISSFMQFKNVNGYHKFIYNKEGLDQEGVIENRFRTRKSEEASRQAARARGGQEEGGAEAEPEDLNSEEAAEVKRDELKNEAYATKHLKQLFKLYLRPFVESKLGLDEEKLENATDSEEGDSDVVLGKRELSEAEYSSLDDFNSEIGSLPDTVDSSDHLYLADWEEKYHIWKAQQARVEGEILGGEPYGGVALGETGQVGEGSTREDAEPTADHGTGMGAQTGEAVGKNGWVGADEASTGKSAEASAAKEPPAARETSEVAETHTIGARKGEGPVTAHDAADATATHGAADPQGNMFADAGRREPANGGKETLRLPGMQPTRRLSTVGYIRGLQNLPLAAGGAADTSSVRNGVHHEGGQYAAGEDTADVTNGRGGVASKGERICSGEGRSGRHGHRRGAT
jgi:hypothetical protein